ncbi:collagen-like repeat preface domain-containing protein, partial [Bacillus thuringiensis]|uniref:collagen-like repeat preface domain-containing protein n=1 Tax=Bacillus thuringiensis TaxID=1428 RepID=UPI003458C86D
MSGCGEKHGELFFGEQGCCIPNKTSIQISQSQLKEFVLFLKNFKKNIERVFSETSSSYTKDLKKMIRISQKFFVYLDLSKEQRGFWNQRNRKLLKILNNSSFSRDMIFNELEQLLLFFFSVVKSFEISNHTLEKLIELLRKIEFILIRYRSTGNEYFPMNVKRPKSIMNVCEVTEEPRLSEAKEKLELSEAKEKLELSEAKEKLELSEAKEKLELSEAKEKLELSEVTEEPELSEAKEKLKLSEVTEEPELSEAKEKLELSEVTEEPELSEVTEEPELSEAKEKLELSEVTEEPELSEVIEEPRLSEVTEKPGLSVITEEPEL